MTPFQLDDQGRLLQSLPSLTPPHRFGVLLARLPLTRFRIVLGQHGLKLSSKWNECKALSRGHDAGHQQVLRLRVPLLRRLHISNRQEAAVVWVVTRKRSRLADRRYVWRGRNPYFTRREDGRVMRRGAVL